MQEQLGRYRLISQLGAGGMGVVYLAEDTVLARRVALKTLRLFEGMDAPARESLTQRFLHEARIVAQMEHPGIVAVYDFGNEGETAYLVLEYVPGTNLSARLEQDPPLDAAFIARVLREAATALDYAHSHGVVHRDVKPANLLLREDGPVKVADFGIAKLAGANTMTATGMVMGTVEYMSPEQIRAETVDARSDQFSLAVVAYHLLTGRRLFQSDSAVSLAHMIAYEEPVAPSTANPALPAGVDPVLRRALAKKPADRYATCTEFVRELEQALAGARQAVPASGAKATAATAALPPTAPLTVQVLPTPPKESNAPPRRKSWLIAAAAVVLLIAGAGAALFMQRTPPRQEAAEPVKPSPSPKLATSSVPARSEPVPAETKPIETSSLPRRPPQPQLARNSEPSTPIAQVEESPADDEPGAGPFQQLSLPELEQRARAGHPIAMTRLGDLYSQGRGVPQNYDTAREWYQKAADKGLRSAMGRMGELYVRGLGVPKDFVVARQWFDRAAAKGFPPAFNQLGRLYREGHGVAQDCGMARQWFERAAAVNNAIAMDLLGQLYEKGCPGFPPNRALARQWFEKAAQRGNPNAKAKLH